VEYLILILLLCFSALFSGLTLGYFSLNLNTLERRAKHGNKEAAAVYPIRKQGNLLLTTLLLGNVAVNSILSVYLGSLVSGVAAGVVATSLIFIFGEILPQATFSRHALWVSSRFAPLMRVIMFVMLPITFPIAFTLNKLLGEEIPSFYSKRELMHIVTELKESELSDVDEDEGRIVHGALQFSHTTVRDIMTPKEKVVMYEKNQRINEDFINHVTDSSFSRYPVYSGNPDNIVGILYSKELLSEEHDTALHQTIEAFDENFLKIRPNEKLDVVLGKMLKQKKHLGVVLSKSQNFLGVVTLEDIIEEIIQFEIEDESDD